MNTNKDPEETYKKFIMFANKGPELVYINLFEQESGITLLYYTIMIPFMILFISIMAVGLGWTSFPLGSALSQVISQSYGWLSGFLPEGTMSYQAYVFLLGGVVALLPLYWNARFSRKIKTKLEKLRRENVKEFVDEFRIEIETRKKLEVRLRKISDRICVPGSFWLNPNPASAILMEMLADRLNFLRQHHTDNILSPGALKRELAGHRVSLEFLQKAGGDTSELVKILKRLEQYLVSLQQQEAAAQSLKVSREGLCKPISLVAEPVPEPEEVLELGPEDVVDQMPSVQEEPVAKPEDHIIHGDEEEGQPLEGDEDIPEPEPESLGPPVGEIPTESGNGDESRFVPTSGAGALA